MGRRIRWLGVIMVACLGLVVAQLVNIQLVKAKALQASPYNPRIGAQALNNMRGEILASDGTVLAESVKTTKAQQQGGYPYNYVREYPQGTLYSGITGYDSILDYGQTGIENYYNSSLERHQQAPQTLSQIIFREQLPSTTDSVTLTIEPKLQAAAQNALSTMPPGINRDGAIVVLNPKTGAILAMYSSPNYDPNLMSSPSLPAEHLAYLGYTTKDHEGYYPLRPLATGETFFPGSTMKVVTSTTAYNLKPALANFDYPVSSQLNFSDSNVPLHADSGSCGGTMTIMLPQSCDPGYGELGIQEGVSTLRQQAELFGINSQPPVDLPSNTQQPVGGVVPSTLQTLPENSQAFQAYTAIGQKTVADTALQNAMVAAGIANGGNVMTPHLMSAIHDSQGALVKSYTPTVYKQAASANAAQSVTALMEGVITQPGATAAGVGFPSYLCAAVKTGTAQTGLNLNHDWMIGFAPANNPQVAIAVVVPFQYIGSDGASVAGPIMNYMMQQALPQGSIQQPCTVQAPPLSVYGH
ncbi:MAG TPA: penicillin-binding transpeptidase domain-containing protein [Acidimicrobiales bacterium]|nr:penicillin-binding transpeptidase domain-containing protein [Acidimicrobiales bacterium]